MNNIKTVIVVELKSALWRCLNFFDKFFKDSMPLMLLYFEVNTVVLIFNVSPKIICLIFRQRQPSQVKEGLRVGHTGRDRNNPSRL